MKLLSNDEFKSIIKLTPLIAFDMIIEYNDNILLGKRINNPAKGFYFIPGGRILKFLSLIIMSEKIDVVKWLPLLHSKNIEPVCSTNP